MHPTDLQYFSHPGSSFELIRCIKRVGMSVAHKNLFNSFKLCCPLKDGNNTIFSSYYITNDVEDFNHLLPVNLVYARVYARCTFSCSIN